MEVQTWMRFCQLVLLGAFMEQVSACISSVSDNTSALWSPEGCSREFWCKHWSCVPKPESWVVERKRKCKQLQRLAVETVTLTMNPDKVLSAAKNQDDDDADGQNDSKDMDVKLFNCLGDDEMLGILQQNDAVKQLSKTLDKLRRRRRRKRIITNFVVIPVAKWSSTISYIIDGTFTDGQKRMIRDAVGLWEWGTCLRFQELSVNDHPEDQHLLFTGMKQLGCYSFIGKVSFAFPQPIYLSFVCFTTVGVVAHEIGHALGLFHVHQRPDRKEYVNINFENIRSSSVAHFAAMSNNFVKYKEYIYDYSSDMHYRSAAFSKNGLDTMSTKDAFQRKVIGQRLELSFMDLKIMNLAYCKKSCPYPLKRECKHKGYQDPNDCTWCKCPDGWGGQFCQLSAGSVGEKCGGELFASAVRKTVASPGYLQNRPYQNGQECSWVIQAREGKKILISFIGDFGLNEYSNKCSHWIEVKYKNDSSLTGARFCGRETPTEKLLSESNEVVLSFKSKEFAFSTRDRRGFQIMFEADGNECMSNPCQNNGMCVDEVARWRCDCFDGYNGERCEIWDPPHIKEKLDIVFMLDDSYFYKKDWQSLKILAKHLASSAEFGLDKTRIGLINYNEYAVIQSSIDGHANLDGFLDTIDQLVINNSPSNIYVALELLKDEMMQPRRGDRKSVLNVVIVLTDSPPRSDLRISAIAEVVEALYYSGTDIIFVGVGPRMNATQLGQIASTTNHFTIIEEYNSLRLTNVLGSIVKLIDKVVEERMKFTTTTISTSDITSSSTAAQTTSSVKPQTLPKNTDSGFPSTTPSTSASTTSPSTSASTSSPTQSTTTIATTSTTTRSTTQTTTTPSTTRSTTQTTTTPTTTSSTTQTTTATTTSSTTQSSTTPSTSASTPSTRQTTSSSKRTIPSTEPSTTSTTTSTTPSTMPSTISTTVTIPSTTSSTTTKPSTTKTSTVPSTAMHIESSPTASESSTTEKETQTSKTSTTSDTTSSIITILSPTTPEKEVCFWTVSECSKTCGGCGNRTYMRLCYTKSKPEYTTKFRFTTSCNVQPCTGWCWSYVAQLYRHKCKPCCTGYNHVGHQCEKERSQEKGKDKESLRA